MEHVQTEPELSAGAMREWEGHVEHVLRGVTHSLNNRAASVLAVVEMWDDPEGTPGSTRIALAAEVERLRELASVLRSIGAPLGHVEAFDPAEAVMLARAIIGLHADLRERSITIVGASALPVRVCKWMFVRALVALTAGAARSRESGGAAIDVRGDGGWVVVRAAGVGPPPALTPYVLETVRAMGGEPLPGGDGFRLPSLADLRRREGR